jgi:hypothetical protein
MTPLDESPAGQLDRANEVRLQQHATAAAQDPRKLAKAVRIVIAGIALERLTFSDLHRELDQRADQERVSA